MRTLICSKTRSIITVIILSAFVFVCLGSTDRAFADPTYLYPRFMPDTRTSTAMGVRGSFKAGQKAALAHINEIRREACKNGYTDPNTGKKMTMADYHPLQWSAALEEYSRLRAAEASVFPSHFIPGDYEEPEHFSDNYLDGFECLAWGTFKTMKGAVDCWYAEKKNYLGNGTGQTGHYLALIDPEMRYVGMSLFDSYGRIGYLSKCASAQFAGELTDPAASGGEAMLPAQSDVLQIISVYNDCLIGSPYITDLTDCEAECGPKRMDTMQTREPEFAVVRKIDSPKGTTLAVDPGPYSFRSSRPSVLKIAPNGSARVLKGGKAVVTAKGPDGSRYSYKVYSMSLFEKPRIKKVRRKGRDLTVTLEIDDLSHGCQIQVAKDRKFKKILKKSTAKLRYDRYGEPRPTTTRTIKKLTKTGALYIRARAYKKTDKNTYYSYWTKPVRVLPSSGRK